MKKENNSSGNSNSNSSDVKFSDSKKNISADAKVSEDFVSKKDSEETKPNAKVDSNKFIYVNPELGSDNFAGLKSVRGQVDGPKRTLRAALRTVASGNEIVLQQSNTPFEVSDKITLKPGEHIVVRPEGFAKITVKK